VTAARVWMNRNLSHHCMLQQLMDGTTPGLRRIISSSRPPCSLQTPGSLWPWFHLKTCHSLKAVCLGS